MCHYTYLQQVCVSMARQPVVLEMLFRAAPAQQGSTNLLIFSLLVPFIHRDGAIGQQARDALLLVMAASASHESVARYIAENSYFCPVGFDFHVLPSKAYFLFVFVSDWRSLGKRAFTHGSKICTCIWIYENVLGFHFAGHKIHFSNFNNLFSRQLKR